jgi:hypothetical protein
MLFLGRLNSNSVRPAFLALRAIICSMPSRCAALLMFLSACGRTIESGASLSVSLSSGLRATHVQLLIRSGQLERKSSCEPIAMKRSIEFGFAQGSLSNSLTVIVQGYADPACENSVTNEQVSVQLELQADKIVLENVVLKPSGRETNCGDGLDEDLDSFVDCDDSDCNGLTCDLKNKCVSASTCQSGACTAGPAVICSSTQGQCLVHTSCVPSIGCVYLPQSQRCDGGTCQPTGVCKP